jgi:hypothetical protein
MAKKSPRNFRAYARMEALNIMLVPGTALVLAPPRNGAELVAMGLAIAACAGFLFVGTAYWAALHRRVTRSDRTSLTRALALADRLERPLLLTIGASTAGLSFAIFARGWSGSNVGAAVLTLLAALEYVNYYHRQLQHFDRWSSFKRLMTSGRFPRSHLARDLAIYRGKGP